MARSNMRTLDSFERQRLKASRRPIIWDVDDDDYDADLDDTELEEATEDNQDDDSENEE